MIAKETIDLYFTGGFVPDPHRTKAKEKYKTLKWHTQGEKPLLLLERSRPNETAKQKQYRVDNYEPFTVGYFNKVLTQVNKIARAEDWGIVYDSKTIAKNNLQEYCETNYPEFDSVQNWFFSFAVKKILEDPNGVFAILPRGILDIKLISEPGPITAPEKIEPVVYYFNSEEILKHTNELTVIQRNEIINGQNTRVLYFFDREQFAIVRETNAQKRQYVLFENTHNFGYKPVIATGGLIEDLEPITGSVLYNSLFYPAIPFWNRAIERESDSNVNFNNHINPDRWELDTNECKTCGGSGFSGAGVTKTVCGVCTGSGYVSNRSNLGVTKIIPVAGENGLEYPKGAPFGYADRPTEPIKIISEEVDKQLYKGLEALSLEKIIAIPLNISGAAKDLDRAEARGFVSDCAKHSVENILRPVYFFINEWLNAALPPDTRKKYMPIIPVPEKIDLATATIYRERVAAGKTSGESSATVGYNEIKLAEKEFGPDSESYLIVREAILLDPLQGKTPEQKDLIKLSGGCTAEEYVLSSKIEYYIRRAAIETEGKFFQMKFAEKTEYLEKLAKETTDKINSSRVLMPVIE